MGMKPMPSDEVCFHCQQAAEKFLKALLQELAIAISKTHSLEALGKLLIPYHASLAAYQHRFKFLSQFAVDYRYPGMHASARQARSAFRWAAAIRAETRQLLGLRPRNP
jgi:HEPN domain-containing protein